MPIPYYIDTTTVDAHTKDLIEQGVAFWQNHTCLRFTELTAPSSPCIQFIKDNGCYSYIGYTGIIQDLSIGVGCEHFGIITHEINHALGVFHEQSRYDRDSYITIDFTNIQPASITNFNEETNTTTTNHNVPYDYGSVMHYGEADFAINPSIPNIYAKEAYQQSTMGQRFKPNFNDLLLINTHYSCLGQCTNTIKCQNSGYQNPANCAECICPEGFGGALCDQRDSGTPNACGTTVQATCEWQTLTGTSGNSQNQLYDFPYECWYHIEAPNGTQIELQFQQAGGYCSFGCFYGDVEVKIANFTNSGYRWCCSDDLPNATLSTESNLAIIGTSSRYLEQTFTVSYKIVNCTETTTTTTTTLKPTTKKPTKQPCKCCNCDESESYESESYESESYESESYESESSEGCGRHHRHKCDC
uniref:Zinc metalloproteinase n=1 Tax=Acrobeloides nanus TaxID=290746 RepID=A0A914EJ05_9BILA